jgi:hypothetical protein
MSRKHPNIPEPLHGNRRDVVAFLQTLLDYEDFLIPVGASIKWGSTTLPNSSFLVKTGQTVQKSDYPGLWSYAENDASYSRTATTVTLPVDAGFVVRAR